jgi:hypothetical protein
MRGTVPYLIKYGPKSHPQRVNLLGTVEFKVSRRTKKNYANITIFEYDTYRTDIAEEFFQIEQIAAGIMDSHWDWGNLEHFHEELAKGYNADTMAGVIYHPPTIKEITDSEGRKRNVSGGDYFTFDMKTISLQSANNFLKPINGKIRIGCCE